MKRFLFTFFISLFIFLIVPFPTIAHSGGTDSNGGHYNRSTGEYHYHHGHSAHQHPNGICPYEEDLNSAAITNNASSETELAPQPRITKTPSVTNAATSVKDTIKPQITLDSSDFSLVLLLVCAVIPTCFWILAYNHKKKSFNSEKQKYQTKIAEYEAKIRQLELERTRLSNTNMQSQSYIQQLQNEVKVLKDDGRIAQLLQELYVIPENVKFTKDRLPYDAATNEKYGSFTTYITYSGSKYHKKKGCCGAYMEAHIINVTRQYYTPCRNCCKEPYKIPDWYKAYKALLDLLK